MLFINDLPETITKSFAGLFRDDTPVAKEINNESDCVDLQEDLDKVFEWTQQWVMTVSNKRKLIVNNYNMNNMVPVQCL